MSDHLSIASFDDFELATRLAGRLSAEGIAATAQSDATDQLLRFYNPHPRAHCHVLVPKAEMETALQRLREIDAREGVLDGATKCPECGSSQVEFPQFSRHTIVGAIPAIVAAAGIIEREFYCAACQFTWAPANDAADDAATGKDLLR